MRWQSLKMVAAVGCALSALAVAAASPASASFVTFESGQVRPLALSPDGTRLFAVNTPDNQLEIFSVAGGTLSHVGAVAVGLEPVAVAARTNGEVWVVNHLSDSVSIVNVAATPPRVTRTLLVGDEPRDIVFAGAGGSRAFITAAHRGQNVPFDPQLTTASIGRADVWVFDAANLGSSLGGTPLTIVTLFGDTPRALAVSPDGATVIAAVFHSGNRTTTVHEGAVCNGGAGVGGCMVNGVTMPGGLPAPNTNADLDPQPEVGLIVRFDGTAWRDELGRNWNNAVRFSLPDRDVFAIDATATPPVEIGSVSGVGTVIFNLAVNPVSGVVYASNTEARNEVRFEGPGIFADSTVRGHLHEARITVLSGPVPEPRHLNKHIDYDVVPSPGTTKARSLATPTGMAVSGDGTTLYVAAFGSSKIGVFNTTALENDTFMPNDASHIAVPGGGPTGLVLDEINDRLYVLTRFDNAISVIDPSSATEVEHRPLHNPEPPHVVSGRPFLYDAALTSSNGEASCAACHIFGDFDSLAWDLGNPDDLMLNNANPLRPGLPNDPDFHPMKGPMTTQSLRGMANHGPMHWRGDRTGSNDAPSAPPNGGAFDEVAAFLKFNVAFAGLLGRSGPLTPAQMQSFTDFILEVTYPPNPIRALDNSLTADQTAGRNFYFNSDPSDTIGTCNFCHTLDTAQAFFGGDGFSVMEPQAVKIPHLRNLYQKVGMFGLPRLDGSLLGINPGDNGFKGDQIRGFGFLHDGSIDTLFRFFNLTGFNQSGGNTGGFSSDLARRQMEAFVLAFDSNLAPIVGQQITLTATNAATVGPRIDLLIQQAGLGRCELVVKGVLFGEARGWHRTAAGTFRSDRAAEPLIGDGALRGQAASAGQERTYTCVPPGSGERIGVDRDEDGHFNRDELDAGSDPADPTSVPTACTSGLAIFGATVKVKRNHDPSGDEKLVVKGEVQLTALPIDPAADGLVVAVSAAGGSLIFTRAVPGGLAAGPSAPGWRLNGAGTKWTFKDASGALAGGVTKVVVSDRTATAPGLYRFTIVGKGSDFRVAAAEVPVELLAVLGSGPDQCATVAFNPDGGPAPTCRLSTSGATLTCR